MLTNMFIRKTTLLEYRVKFPRKEGSIKITEHFSFVNDSSLGVGGVTNDVTPIHSARKLLLRRFHFEKCLLKFMLNAASALCLILKEKIFLLIILAV